MTVCQLMPPLRIAIAGAGTAGLAAAAFLCRDGHDVQLYERFAEPRPVGAGLMLQPTGLACLASLGLDRAMIERGQVIDRIDGRTIAGARIFDAGYTELGPHYFGLGVRRGALFGLLHDEVRRLGIPVSAATDIRSSRCEADRRLLADAGGKELGPFDLVVDGTGARSVLRTGEVHVRIDRPYPYGALWGIVDMPRAWPHPHTLAQVYDGCHLMVGILPVGRAPDDGRPLAAFFWSLRVRDHAAWREAGMDAWRRQVVRAWPAVEPFVIQFRCGDDLTLATYADIALGSCAGDRIVFIGDAGRLTSPQLGQGANLALIDAATLARCLREQPSVPEAVAAYAVVRRAHTRFYSLASRLLTPFFQSDSRLAAAVRDRTFPLMGKVPYLRREMARTLAGMKTGLFRHLDPGQWHEDYALRRAAAGTALHAAARTDVE